MKIFNTLTRSKEEFKPIEEGKVKIYACGPTVYNFIHIGNARPLCVFDVLRRFLEYIGYDVRFVQNFTDIDDKMINRANREGITVSALADRFIGEYYTDAEGLNIKKATVHPRATENVDAIIDIIKKLIESGHAYEVDGDVYYRTKSFSGYGKLSHLPLDELEAGARIGVDDRKQDPMDFALWKAQKPGEPAWESPWGMGRPGWHIECSAMATKYLGKTIDIHGGGKDLIFPHHENEIAQSEAANNCEFAHYWMHNGYINIDNKKMSKSAGNFFTVRDIVKEFDYEVIRFFMLSAHYRSPINFSKELLEQAQSGLDRIKNCFGKLEFSIEHLPDGECDKEISAQIDKYVADFKAAMDDDLNTAAAIAAIFDIAKLANTTLDLEGATKQTAEYMLAAFSDLTGVLGIVKEDKADSIDSEIEELIKKRTEAKKNKNFAEADQIRAKLLDMGIVLEDTRAGVKWSRK